MAQKQPPPCYQEYAATMLARMPFRLMTLEERGLLYTLRLECWVNKRLPCTPEKLASALGLPLESVARSWNAVMAFFQVDGDQLFSVELENYRVHLEEIRAKQSAGAKKAAKRTNSVHLDGKKQVVAPPSGNLQVTRESVVKHSKAEHSQKQGNQGTLINGSTDCSSQYREEYDRNTRIAESAYTSDSEFKQVTQSEIVEWDDDIPF